VSTSFRKDFPVLIEMTLLSASVVLKKFLKNTKVYANFKMYTQWALENNTGGFVPPFIES